MSAARDRDYFSAMLRELLPASAGLRGNHLVLSKNAQDADQAQTNAAFTSKWAKYADRGSREKLYEMQRRWYLSLYGFAAESELAQFLNTRRVIFDAGCGLGYKSAWFAALAPESLVIGMDFSEAATQAAQEYSRLGNLFFIQGDIAGTSLADSCIDYVSCDQTIMHTQNPDATFGELRRVTAHGGQLACYFYAKKALPRELLDDYFRQRCKGMSEEELWQMSQQLTELGRRLSDLQVTIDAPAVPALGIKGGRYDLQRFLYWNFLKCFWNPELGTETSVVTNFDWYSPSNARRYTEAEVRELVQRESLSIVHFHQEEACYSGRFLRS
jgi:ubiquinone/menaquinone biosynthesis C-methylase UbiE